MASPHNHHQKPRPLRLSVPPSARFHPSSPPSPFPFSPSASTLSTPSKLRRHSLNSSSPSSSSYSSVVLLLFSLRSLYSLLPFLRSSPPSLLSLFPFSFLVSLLSFLLLSLLSLPHLLPLPPLAPYLPSLSLNSSLLALSLLLRFHALRSCGTAATILADLSGSLLASSISRRRRRQQQQPSPRRLLGFLTLPLALLALSRSWDCAGALPIFLPFLSGFLSYHEKAYAARAPLRQLGRQRIRCLSLAFATLLLFFPALICVMMSDGGWGDGSASISVWSVGWPLLNTVIFGVLLNENFFQSDEKVGGFSGKDLQREFAVTYFCTLVLEMLYYPKLSLPWFLLCGLLMWVSVRELCGWTSLDYVEIGSATDASESLYVMVMNPIRHILSERKSRKIAVFLLINTGYMVVEFVAGFMSNSLGLISDACHMLFDCAALAIGLYASYISRLPADHQYNYGRGRTEVLSGYVNAVLLVLVGVLIVLESFERILDPQEISTNSLLIVSVGGLLVNVVGLIFFHEEHHHAHGGGGTCSHSHSHSHSHSDHHHDKHDSITVRDHGPNADHHKCVEVSHEISNDHSHAGHDQHHSCSDHNNHHPHDSSKEKEDSHDHHCHGHGHDHHCHEKEHDHHDHSPKAEVYIHYNSVEPMHNLQRLDASSENSLGHSHESHEHNHRHGDKKNCSNKETVNPNGTQDHSHVHSCHLKKSSPHKDSERHHHIDHNMEGIFLHVLADTMGSVGVVISTLLIKYKGWLVADPACSIFISVMIVASVIPLLRNSAEILLQRIPRAHEQYLNIAADALMRIKGVCGVQKLHVWNFTNTDIVGTVHLHVSAETDKASVKTRASDLLREAGIKDITIQVECVKG